MSELELAVIAAAEEKVDSLRAMRFEPDVAPAESGHGRGIRAFLSLEHAVDALRAARAGQADT